MAINMPISLYLDLLKKEANVNRTVLVSLLELVNLTRQHVALYFFIY